VFTSLATNEQTDGRTDAQTDGQVENIMPRPASLAWPKRKKSKCLDAVKNSHLFENISRPLLCQQPF